MSVKVFCCYAREDQQLLLELKAHLANLQRQGTIEIWADTDIEAGTEWNQEIKKHLNTASIILLLISQYFMNSDYCYSIEMKRALERHERGEARVIPIILRPVYWQRTPFSKLQVLPTDAKPITSSSWNTLEEAFRDVTKSITKIVANERSEN
jgi:hypothetical protein